MDSKKTVYPYIPNSAPDVQAEMMAEVGISDVMELYEEIPEAFRYQGALNLPEAIPDEQGIKRHIERILSKNKNCNEFSNFMGAGCAQHYVPAVCDEIASRGELLTTYGAETWADHGKYQIFFEYQSLMAELLDMSFLTVPCHCGGQASATGLRMACRITGRNKVLLPHTMNRQNLALVRNYLKMIDPDQEIKIELVACRSDTGMLDLEDLKSRLDQDTAAVYIENPTFLGIIETQGEEIGKLAKAAGAEFIVYTDPISLGVLEAPANYGATICVGDLHGLGLHLNFGGGQAGFIASHDDMRYITEFKELVDGMVETTVPGEQGYSVVLIERTHYAMRENGKEFTGTQNNLWTAPVAVYLSLMGPKGMEEIGHTIMTNAKYAAKKLAGIPGVSLRFPSVFFKEFVVNFDKTGKTVEEINQQLLSRQIFGGVDLSRDYPELGQSALYCVTETADKESIDRLAGALQAILN